MDGILETTVTLGLCKLGCGLLSLPTLRSHLSTIGLCCSCLLLFTDLGVTGGQDDAALFSCFHTLCFAVSHCCLTSPPAFLALLWMVGGSWIPPLAMQGDVIALRFLLFLGHTYGTVLLLTFPLVAVDMASMLGRPRERWWDMADGGRKQCLMHTGSFLSCLLIWVVCGLRRGLSGGLEEQHAEACMVETGSLFTCLPDLLSVTLAAAGDPTLALFGLLTLAFNLSVSGCEPPQSSPQPIPAVPRAILDTTGTSCGDCKSCLLQFHCELIYVNLPQGAIVMQDPSSHPQGNTVHLQGRGADTWGWVTSCLRGRVLTGLVCCAVLYLFPPAMSVNMVLIRYLECLAEWTLLSLPREMVASSQLLLLNLQRDGSTGVTVHLMEEAREG